jgi:hypothetical protein
LASHAVSASGLLLRALLKLYLTPEHWQSQFDFVDLELIRGGVSDGKKLLIRCECFRVFSKIIVRGGNKIMRDRDLRLRTQYSGIASG